MSSPYSKSINLTMPNGEVVQNHYDQSDLNTQGIANIKATHIVKEGETLHSIANQYYGDSGQWYRILVFNGYIDPFEIQPLDKLYIPS